LKKLRNLLNMIWITVGISSIVAPIIGLKLRGSPNGAAQYSPSQYVNTAIYCGVSYFAGVIFLWIIRAYLIARDEILENEQATHTDTDVLYVQISCYKIFKSLFKMKLNRLVWGQPLLISLITLHHIMTVFHVGLWITKCFLSRPLINRI
jgi:hypothetical protein